MPKSITSFKTTVFLLVILSSLSSCYSLMLNGNTQNITVATSKPAIIKHGNQHKNTRNNKASIEVDRFKPSIDVIVEADSAVRHINVAPNVTMIPEYSSRVKKSASGMVAEKQLLNTFPHHIYIDLDDTLNTYEKHGAPPKKGDVRLHFSLPHINSFYFKPDGETAKSKAGFLGIAGGFDYFYNDKQFINVSAAGVLDFFLPFPAPVDYNRDAEREQLRSAYLSLSNNHVMDRLTIGYGITYAANRWDLTNLLGIAYFNDKYLETSTGRVPKTVENTAFGLIFSSYYKLGTAFNLGVIYRPTFLRLNTVDRFKYEHLISVDLAWKIKLFNLSRKR